MRRQPASPDDRSYDDKIVKFVKTSVTGNPVAKSIAFSLRVPEAKLLPHLDRLVTEGRLLRETRKHGTVYTLPF